MLYKIGYNCIFYKQWRHSLLTGLENPGATRFTEFGVGDYVGTMTPHASQQMGEISLSQGF